MFTPYDTSKDSHFHRIQFLVRVVDSYAKAHFIDQLDYFLRRKDTGPLEYYYRTARQWQESVLPHLDVRYVRERLIPSLRDDRIIGTDPSQEGGLWFRIIYAQLIEIARARELALPDWCVDAANDPALVNGTQARYPLPQNVVPTGDPTTNRGTPYHKSRYPLPQNVDSLYIEEKEERTEKESISIYDLPYLTRGRS